MSRPFTFIDLIYIRKTSDYVKYLFTGKAKPIKLCGIRAIIVLQGDYFGRPMNLDNDSDCAVDYEFYQIYPGHEAHWLRYKQYTHDHERLNMYLFEEKDINIKYV